MEIKQLEYFLVACEEGSLNKAAERLFTSQPNVSKIIHALERDLGYALFERTNKGLRLTEKGQRVQEYAKHIIQHVEIIEGIGVNSIRPTLTISSYPSNMVAHILVDMYKEEPSLVIRHQQGTVEEITDQVSCGESEIGILYISHKQLGAFRHIISHKKLNFVALDTKEACVYVGPHHPLYKEESLDFAQLQHLRFVRGTQEFFSMEHHLEQVSLGTISTEQLDYGVYTNSDHLTIDLLLNTDICSLGINFMCNKYEQYDIKMLPIKHSEPFLSFGYVYGQEHELSSLAQQFIGRLEASL